MNNFIVLEEICQTQFSTILRCKNKTTRDIVVLKEIRQKKTEDAPSKEVLREILIMMNFTHPHIVKYNSVFVHKCQVVIEMEFCITSLSNVIKKISKPFYVGQIKKIVRPTDVPETGLLCDLLWSDPDESAKDGYGENDRGVSVIFNGNVVKGFLENNNLDLICRAHQVVEEGYEFFGNRQLVTVFSAPNYCGEFDNNGAIMDVDENLMCSFKVIKGGDKTK